MPRAVLLGVVLPVLAAACALFEPPPPPPGTEAVSFEIQNMTSLEFRPYVRPGTDITFDEDATDPEQLPAIRAGSTMNATFFVPTADYWSIWFDETLRIEKRDLEGFGDCPLFIRLEVDGGSAVGCTGP
jgi:hypothetical protein